MTIADATDVTQDLEEQGRFRSARGRFKIFKAPKIKRRRQIPEDFDTSAIIDGFDYSPLLVDNDEADVRTKLDGMIRAINPGVSETLLFSQKGPQGMSLVHVWFGANMPLFRHSHPPLRRLLVLHHHRRGPAGFTGVGRRRRGIHS